MSRSPQYGAKLQQIETRTLLPRLDPKSRKFLRRLAAEYRFTFQELRRVSQVARDLQMWREEPLEPWWSKTEKKVRLAGRERKKELMRLLEHYVDDLITTEKTYPREGLRSPPRRSVRLREVQTDKRVFGLCPAYSEHTVCCGLHTIDAVRGCPYSCSYCTIQTFYGDTAELEADLVTKLHAIELDPARRYHVGTGQSSDSLVWGNRGGLLDALIEFARSNPNVLLELKTKSANVTPLIDRAPPSNLVCSWSLGTETTIRNEEPGTAALAKRLDAASQVAAAGHAIGFHFHPMIHYAGWRHDYGQVAARLLEQFGPAQVSFISLGSVTLIRPVEREIRRRGGETKILQMKMVQDPHGKLTYADEVKIELFNHLYSALEPWHEDVFFYLCMERPLIWQRVLGYAYPSNQQFENDFLDRCLRRNSSTASPQ